MRVLTPDSRKLASEALAGAFNRVEQLQSRVGEQVDLGPISLGCHFNTTDGSENWHCCFQVKVHIHAHSSNATKG